MELKETLSKKPVKFLTLLLTAMLIATASAAVYYSLSMQPQVTVTGLTVRFYTAPDTPSSSTVNPAWCLLALKSYPNATLTYDKAVYINNTDGDPHQIQLVHVSISPANNTASVGNWTFIRFYLYNSTGLVTSFNYTTTGDYWNLPTNSPTGYFSMPASTGWWIKVETRSPANAVVNEVCTIVMSVDVQE